MSALGTAAITMLTTCKQCWEEQLISDRGPERASVRILLITLWLELYSNPNPPHSTHSSGGFSNKRPWTHLLTAKAGRG